MYFASTAGGGAMGLVFKKSERLNLKSLFAQKSKTKGAPEIMPTEISFISSTISHAA